MFTTITTYICRYFRAIFLGAVLGGLIFPSFLAPTYMWLTPLIVGLMYLGSLDIDYSQLPSLTQYRKNIIGYYVIMMLVLPLSVFYASKGLLGVDIATGLFLLTIAPAGIASVAFTRMMGGNSLLALCLAIVTTISFPFLLPLVTSHILGNTLSIDSISMLYDLVLYCILPILGGYITQRYIPSIQRGLAPHIDWMSIVMIAIMIAGPVAYNASVFLDLDISFVVLTVGGLFVLSTLIHVVGWMMFGKQGTPNAIASSLSKGFMNISIVTVIAAKYFSPMVLLIVMLYEFPWDLMLIPFKRFAQKMK